MAIKLFLLKKWHKVGEVPRPAGGNRHWERKRPEGQYFCEVCFIFKPNSQMKNTKVSS
jgi:hypothetical protein